MELNKNGKRPRMEPEDDLWGDEEFTAEEFDEIQSQVESRVESQFTLSLNLPYNPSSPPSQVRNVRQVHHLPLTTHQASQDEQSFALEGQVKMLQENLARVKSEKEQLRVDLVTKHSTEVKVLTQNATSLETQLQFKGQELKALVQRVQHLEAQLKSHNNNNNNVNTNSKEAFTHKIPKMKDISPIKPASSQFVAKNSFLSSTHVELPQPLETKPVIPEPRPRSSSQPTSSSSSETQRKTFRKPKNMPYGLPIEEPLLSDPSVSDIHQLVLYLTVLVGKPYVPTNEVVASLKKLTTALSMVPNCQTGQVLACSLVKTPECFIEHNLILEAIIALGSSGRVITPELLEWRNASILMLYFHNPENSTKQLRAIPLRQMLVEFPSELGSLLSLELLQLVACPKNNLVFAALCNNTKEPTLLSVLRIQIQKYPGLVHKMVDLLTSLVAEYGVRPLIHAGTCMSFLSALVEALALEMEAYKTDPSRQRQVTLDQGLGFLSHITYFFKDLKFPKTPPFPKFLWGMAKLAVRNSDLDLNHSLYNVLNYDSCLSAEVKGIPQ